jgi:hypothetical protein
MARDGWMSKLFKNGIIQNNLFARNKLTKQEHPRSEDVPKSISKRKEGNKKTSKEESTTAMGEMPDSEKLRLID